MANLLVRPISVRLQTIQWHNSARSVRPLRLGANGGDSVCRWPCSLWDRAGIRGLHRRYPSLACPARLSCPRRPSPFARDNVGEIKAWDTALNVLVHGFGFDVPGTGWWSLSYYNRGPRG
jgi:hypothetical protein